MCLQDLQLWRSAKVVIHNVSQAGAGTYRILDSDSSRIGFVFLGPGTSTVNLRLTGSSVEHAVGTIPSTTLPNARSFTIYDLGPAIQSELWINVGGAFTATIYEYLLPLDPENLKRLAATGKW